MPSITASKARAKLYRLIDEVGDSHEPVQILGKRNNAILVSEEDWRAIEETLLLNRIPGLVKSIHRASKEPLSKGTKLKDLKW